MLALLLKFLYMGQLAAAVLCCCYGIFGYSQGVLVCAAAQRRKVRAIMREALDELEMIEEPE